MIVDRYDPVNLFELVPKLNLQFEPELAHLDRLLDDDELFNLVKADLLKRHPNSGRCGRHSTPVEVILRMLIVKRLYNFSYEQTQRFVNESIVLRQFCRLYLEKVPDDTTPEACSGPQSFWTPCPTYVCPPVARASVRYPKPPDTRPQTAE